MNSLFLISYLNTGLIVNKKPHISKMGQVLKRMMDVLYTKKLEVVLVGLENSGKTTLLTVLGGGVPTETAPTIGLNVKMVKPS